MLYILGLGSPTHPLPPESYAAYCATYEWKNIYDRELLYSGPLFTHQLSHMWIDFRGIRDAFMRDHGTDYFENTRQATFVQQEYAIRNPKELAGYDPTEEASSGRSQEHRARGRAGRGDQELGEQPARAATRDSPPRPVAFAGVGGTGLIPRRSRDKWGLGYYYAA